MVQCMCPIADCNACSVTDHDALFRIAHDGSDASYSDEYQYLLRIQPHRSKHPATQNLPPR